MNNSALVEIFFSAPLPHPLVSSIGNTVLVEVYVLVEMFDPLLSNFS
jgi:hypothetical protein